MLLQSLSKGKGPAHGLPCAASVRMSNTDTDHGAHEEHGLTGYRHRGYGLHRAYHRRKTSGQHTAPQQHGPYELTTIIDFRHDFLVRLGFGAAVQQSSLWRPQVLLGARWHNGGYPLDSPWHRLPRRMGQRRDTGPDQW